MKKSFNAYYMPSNDEFQDLWDKCNFVLDANVLLNIYRYSPETRDEFLKILNNIKERLWVPHQAGKEYHTNRLRVIKQQENAYDELIDNLNNYSEDISKIFNKIDSDLKSYKKHPFIDGETYSKQLEKLPVNPELQKIIDELKNSKKNHPDYTFRDDKLMDEITILLEGKIGSKCPPDKLEKLYKEGKKRYSRDIPPGFEDAQKDKSDRTGLKKYGDLIIWFQMIDKAKESKLPLVFVTDDEKKGDWFLRINNTTFGPRPELIEEMKEKAGVNFYLYTANRFMEYSQAYLDLDFEVDKGAIEEVRNISLKHDSWKSILTPTIYNNSDYHYAMFLRKIKRIEDKLNDLEIKLSQKIPLNVIIHDLDTINSEVLEWRNQLETELKDYETSLDSIIQTKIYILNELEEKQKTDDFRVDMYKSELKNMENQIIKLKGLINSCKIQLSDLVYVEDRIERLCNSI